jgi:hypothetical protein
MAAFLGEDFPAAIPKVAPRIRELLAASSQDVKQFEDK